MEILPLVETFVPLQPPAAPFNGALTHTDAAGSQDPTAAAESTSRAEQRERITEPEPESRSLEAQRPSSPITNDPETTVHATSEPPKKAAESSDPVPQVKPLEDTPRRSAVDSERPTSPPTEATQPRDAAIAAQEPKHTEGELTEKPQDKDVAASESETDPFHEPEVLSGAVRETSAESRDSPHLPQEGSCTAAHDRIEDLPEPAHPTETVDTPAATDSSATPVHISSEPRADDQSLGAPMPVGNARSLNVNLKYRSELAQPAETAGASPESSSSTLEMAVTRQSGAQTAATQLEVAMPNQAPTSQPQTNLSSENFAPGLYARERNTRRAATKAFREPPTPKKAQAPVLSEELAVKLVLSPQPQPEARPAKRKAPEPKTVVVQKKRKGSDDSSKARRSTQEEPLSTDRLLSLASSQADAGQQRPLRDQETDEAFAKLVCDGLKVQIKARRADMGKRQAVRILDLLELGSYPSEEEALFLTTEEATAEVAQGQFTKRIIVTTDQQRVPLQTVDQFLGEYYDEDALVWIQDPEVRPTKKAPITRQVKISQVKERFAAEPTNKPWNLLELATHCDDGLRPIFLNNEDCRLLTKLKIPESHAGPEARRRTYLPGYKEVEKWALVAEAGALTEPHQDSHGYSTFITVNMGLVGFGWLSNPTKADRDAWRRNPSNFRGGQWRYIVLKPGQTVYFPAGTVHFVFRLPAAGNTLAFGGHILRCSNIVHWVRTLLEERDQKEVTNEDLTGSAPGYLARVEKFVNQAKVNGTAEKWGGEESIEEFLRLKKEFLSRRQK